MKTKSLLFLYFFFSLLNWATAQFGNLDNTFGEDGIATTAFLASPDFAADAVLQPDGKVLVAGSYTSSPNSRNEALVRYEMDGTLDQGFGDGGIATFDWPGGLTACAIQPDGKIVVVLSPPWLSDSSFVARVTTEGWMDTTFGTNGIQGVLGNAFSIAVQNDGKILLSGSNKYRLLEDGSKDPDFSGNGSGIAGFKQKAVTAQPDGKILFVGEYSDNFGLVRFLPDGTWDTGFGSGGLVITDLGGDDNESAFSLAIQPDGKFVLMGRSDDNNVSRLALVRYHPDGTLDNSFGNNGITLTSLEGENPNLQSIYCQPDGKIVVAGALRVDSQNEFILFRYNEAGTLDESFDSDGWLTVDFGTNAYAVSGMVHPDGKILAAGATSEDFAMARILSDGSLDPTFGIDGTLTLNLVSVSGLLRDFTLLPDETIVAVGTSGDGRAIMTKYFSDGTLDTTFGNEGWSTYGTGGFCYAYYSVVSQPDNKFLVSKHFGACSPTAHGSGSGVARYLPGGTQDNTISFGGFTDYDYSSHLELYTQSDDKLIAVYEETSFPQIYRYNHDGSFDLDFGLNGAIDLNNYYALAVLPDDKILVGHSVFPDTLLTRYHADGTLDESFGTDGSTFIDFGPEAEISQISIQTNGKIILTWAHHDIVVACLNPDGSLDTNFGTDGLTTIDFGYTDQANGLLTQLDGKILVAGTSSIDEFSKDFILLRLNADGTPDVSFGDNGMVRTDIGDIDILTSIAIQQDGIIIVGGTSDGKFTLARYISGLEISAIKNTESLTLLLSPNPASNSLNIELPENITGPIEISLFDSQGRLMGQQEISDGYPIAVEYLPHGFYSVRLTDGKRVYVGKFVKK